MKDFNDLWTELCANYPSLRELPFTEQERDVRLQKDIVMTKVGELFDNADNKAMTLMSKYFQEVEGLSELDADSAAKTALSDYLSKRFTL